MKLGGLLTRQAWKSRLPTRPSLTARQWGLGRTLLAWPVGRSSGSLLGLWWHGSEWGWGFSICWAGWWWFVRKFSVLLSCPMSGSRDFLFVCTCCHFWVPSFSGTLPRKHKGTHHRVIPHSLASLSSSLRCSESSLCFMYSFQGY